MGKLNSQENIRVVSEKHILSGFQFSSLPPLFGRDGRIRYGKAVVFIGSAQQYFDGSPVHGDGYGLLVKIPRAQQIRAGKVSGIKSPGSLEVEKQ